MSGVGPHSVSARISECAQCSTPLPLCEAERDCDARIWICSGCGSEYSAELASSYTIDELRGVHPEPAIFDPDTVIPVSNEVMDFARRIGARTNDNIEKRGSKRHPVVATLTAIEFDDRLRAVGTPFQTISRNLSTGGICLINNRAILSKFVVLGFVASDGQPIQTLAHVLRRRPLGPYHEVGTEFVTKLASSNSKLMI